MSRRTRLALAGALLLALAGCRPPEQRAANAAARSDAYMAAGDLNRARVEIRNAIKLDEDKPDYWQRLARIELLSNNIMGVYSAYSRVLELQRDNVEALEWLATISVAAGDQPGGQKYLDQLMVLSPKSIRGRLAQGTLAMKQKRPDDAIRIADGIIADAPTIDDAWILKAIVLDDQKRTPEAIQLLEQRAIQPGGGSVPVLSKLLDFYKTTDNEAGLRNTYLRLFRLQPKNTRLQIEFARTLYERGKPAEADKVIRAVQARNRGDADTQLEIIRFYRATAGQAVAMAELARIAATAPQLRTALASYLLEEKQPAAAKRLLAPLVDGKPVSADNVDAQLIYAAAFKDLGETAAARALLDRILDFDTTNSRALLLRTDLEVRAKELDAALGDVRVLVRDNPQFEPGALMLGEVYAARGDQALAKRAFQTAVDANPDSTLTLASATDYLSRRGDYGAAMKIATDFTRKHPLMVDGWARQGDICVAASNQACVAGVVQVLNRLQGGQDAARVLAQTFQQRAATGQILAPQIARAVDVIAAGGAPLPQVVQSLVSANHLREARQITLELIKRQPTNSLAQVVNANLVIVGGNEAGGRALLRGIIGRFPDEPRAYADLALSLHRAGDDAGAFAAMNGGLQRLPNNPTLLANLAGLQILADRTGDAVATLRRIVAASPDDLLSINNLASLLADHGRTPAEREEAVSLSGRLSAHDTPGFNDTRGWALVRVGRPAQGIPLIQKALDKAPGVPVFTYHLGAARIATGDRTNGAKLVQQALARAAPGDDWVGAARALLGTS